MEIGNIEIETRFPRKIITKKKMFLNWGIYTYNAHNDHGEKIANNVEKDKKKKIV